MIGRRHDGLEYHLQFPHEMAAEFLYLHPGVIQILMGEKHYLGKYIFY